MFLFKALKKNPFCCPFPASRDWDCPLSLCSGPQALLNQQWKTVSVSYKITLTSACFITSFSFIYHIISFSEFDSSSVSLFYSSRTQLLSLLFSLPVVSNSLQPHGLQHARPPCPAPSPKVCPSSCPLHQWCHLAISSSAFKPSRHQGLFQWVAVRIRWPHYWSFSISPSNEYWFP